MKEESFHYSKFAGYDHASVWWLFTEEEQEDRLVLLGSSLFNRLMIFIVLISGLSISASNIYSPAVFYIFLSYHVRCQSSQFQNHLNPSLDELLSSSLNKSFDLDPAYLPPSV